MGGIYHVWGREEVNVGFYCRNQGEGDHLEDPGVEGRIIIKWILKKWIESMWLRTGTGGGLL